MSAPLVIIGTGLAGYTLTREWRKLDAHTPLLMLSRDAAGFYSKPMLSNALASGKTPATLVNRSAEQMAQELRADIRPRSTVQAIDMVARSLRWTDGAGAEHTSPWRDLVLAVGADPISLPVAGTGAGRIRSVNDLDDFAHFLDEIDGAQRVVILGAGLIGCEFANDLLARGIQAVVVDPAETPLGRLLPREAGLELLRRLRAAGIDLRPGISVERVDASVGRKLAITLSDGSQLQADAVLSAVGLRPRVGLAQQAGLMTARGIVVDRCLRTTAANVHALGDCVELQHEGVGHVLPYVMPLMQQARALAVTLAEHAAGHQDAPGAQHGKPVSYPAMPVTVKTPACPTVVCPPPPSAAVEWTTEITEAGCTALARSADGALRGFALLGDAVGQKSRWVKEVPALMP